MCSPYALTYTLTSYPSYPTPFIYSFLPTLTQDPWHQRPPCPPPLIQRASSPYHAARPVRRKPYVTLSDTLGLPAGVVLVLGVVTLVTTADDVYQQQFSHPIPKHRNRRKQEGDSRSQGSQCSTAADGSTTYPSFQVESSC
ncbi:hypothetical protein G7K_0649-t1 [Saitoella complicata NRRL Y-17804]|uniref:Uncharacterized protein n=1 Tax=Saitoella complicata (strain BCRC 22490 / CBS 7301 / JCM 7358 / NBRC 10748 / NRRL Y-17804) TaxID=698492 RepID=A0A0E9N9F8_SAICN|nr:hypothetical protein G7K_0649-t1 [Saitoella complicata NRRL Y-17804]